MSWGRKEEGQRLGGGGRGKIVKIKIQKEMKKEKRKILDKFMRVMESRGPCGQGWKGKAGSSRDKFYPK